MSEKSNEEIGKLIDRIQSGLVELFDQLRELRRLLELNAEGSPDSSIGIVETTQVFSDSRKSVSPESASMTDTDALLRPETEVDRSSVLEADRPQPARPEPVGESPAAVSVGSTASSGRVTDMSATLSRLLDPIVYELRTDNASAEVIAEYVQAAKDRLITREHPNEKVARDIDVVLRFLKARGKRAIKPEERDNILTRINRWKLHLSVSAP